MHISLALATILFLGLIFSVLQLVFPWVKLEVKSYYASENKSISVWDSEFTDLGETYDEQSTFYFVQAMSILMLVFYVSAGISAVVGTWRLWRFNATLFFMLFAVIFGFAGVVGWYAAVGDRNQDVSLTLGGFKTTWKVDHFPPGFIFSLCSTAMALAGVVYIVAVEGRAPVIESMMED